MRKLLVIFLSLIAVAAAKPDGTLEHPYQPSGPQGKWVTNGHWTMRLTEVRHVSKMDDYLALPWTDKLAGETKAKHLEFMKKRVFGAKKQVILVTVEAKNLGDVKDFSREGPLWKLRTDSSSTGGAGAHNEGVAMNCLEGGMPSKGKLKTGKIGKGTLVFIVPDYAYATTLFFESLRHSRHGETQSLVLKIDKPAGAKPKMAKREFLIPVPLVDDVNKTGSWKKPYKGKGPLGAWVTNGHWMMRVVATGEVKDLKTYEGLPWTKRMDAETAKKHFNYMKKYVFKAKKNKKMKRVFMFTVEAKNLNDRAMDFGVGSPPWKLKVSNAKKPIGTGLHNQLVGIWCLQGGMPKKTLLKKNGGKGKGTLLFFLAEDQVPENLYFKTLKHSKDGETGSLVIEF